MVNGRKWIKLDANYPEDPRIIGLTPNAELLWIRILAACGRASIARLTRAHCALIARGLRGQRAPIEQLLRAGLIVEDGDWIEVPNWERWNGNGHDTPREQPQRAALLRWHRDGKHTTPHSDCPLCSKIRNAPAYAPGCLEKKEKKEESASVARVVEIGVRPAPPDGGTDPHPGGTYGQHRL